MIYKTRIQNRFFELNTSNDYDPDQPLEVSMKTHWYAWGVEIDLVAIKYAISIYMGYQHLHIVKYDDDGHIEYEMKRE